MVVKNKNHNKKVSETRNECHCEHCHCADFKKLILVELATIIITVLVTLAIVGAGHRGYRGECRGPQCERMRDNYGPCPCAKDWDKKGWDRKDDKGPCPYAKDGKDNRPMNDKKNDRRDNKKNNRKDDKKDSSSKTETTNTTTETK